MQYINSVVIVGGGSAGWLTAGLIAAHHKAHLPGNLKVTLVESANIKSISVGEGTWPTMRATLKKLGVTESDFIKECDATFKQGAKFSKWTTGAEDDFYYHPLMLPQDFGHVDLASSWQALQGVMKNGDSFSQSVCFQEALCEAGLAPKNITMPEYGAVANYAYHLDSSKFGKFLNRHCKAKLGVKHIIDDINGVVSKNNGDIDYLNTQSGEKIQGDLYIDCTGFSSILLGRHYGVKFQDKSDVLFIDTALTTHVPYESEHDPIASHTISTGQSAGWVWDIGLPSRRGVGHVYSSKYISEDEAIAELSNYIGPVAKDLEFRKIPIKSGYREKFWVNNCVAVGLSAGFLEPLEASALVLIELSANMISEQMPVTRSGMDITASKFNTIFNYRWERIIDFLKLHYMLTKRTDTKFWIDNCLPETIPESLRNQLELWQYRVPSDFDFDSLHEVFPAASYLYVLYGMGFKTDISRQSHKLQNSNVTDQSLKKNIEIKKKVLANLPTNRDLINKVHEFGFQRL